MPFGTMNCVRMHIFLVKHSIIIIVIVINKGKLQLIYAL